MLIGLLKRLVGRNPTSDKVAMTSELAEVDRLALLGDLGAAIVRCQAMRERFGAQVPILVKLGSLLARSGAVVEARELLERVLAVEPEHFEAIFALGTLSLIEGRFEEAGRQLDLALVQQPDNSAVLLNRGQVAMRTRAFDVAVNCFRQALACNPCNPEAAEPLFYLLIQLEAYDAALDLVDGLIASEPDNGRWWRMKGFLLFKRYYEPEEAERCFALAESSQASDAAYWTERGICARDRGVLHQALACFEQALTLSPTDPLAKFHRGLTHLYAENYAAGWPDYEARFADAGLQAVKLPGKPWGGGGWPAPSLSWWPSRGWVMKSCSPPA